MATSESESEPEPEYKSEILWDNSIIHTKNLLDNFKDKQFNDKCRSITPNEKIIITNMITKIDDLNNYWLSITPLPSSDDDDDNNNDNDKKQYIRDDYNQLIQIICDESINIDRIQFSRNNCMSDIIKHGLIIRDGVIKDNYINIVQFGIWGKEMEIAYYFLRRLVDNLSSHLLSQINDYVTPPKNININIENIRLYKLHEILSNLYAKIDMLRIERDLLSESLKTSKTEITIVSNNNNMKEGKIKTNQFITDNNDNNIHIIICDQCDYCRSSQINK